MNFFEFEMENAPTFTAELVKRRKDEALRTEGAKQFQWLSSKLFPMMKGKKVDAVFLAALALLEFSLHVMQEREDRGITPV